MSALDAKAVARGALAGLLVIVPLTALRAVLDRALDDFESSAWVPLFALGLFVAYVVAGSVAGRRAPGAPMSNGMVAGVGALAGWLVIRVLIWAVREPGRGLFSGSEPVLTVGRLFGAALFAAVFGLVGALIGARMGRGGESAGRPRTGIHPSEERPDSAGHGAG